MRLLLQHLYHYSLSQAFPLLSLQASLLWNSFSPGIYLPATFLLPPHTWHAASYMGLYTFCCFRSSCTHVRILCILVLFLFVLPCASQGKEAGRGNLPSGGKACWALGLLGRQHPPAYPATPFYLPPHLPYHPPSPPPTHLLSCPSLSLNSLQGGWAWGTLSPPCPFPLFLRPLCPGGPAFLLLSQSPILSSFSIFCTLNCFLLLPLSVKHLSLWNTFFLFLVTSHTDRHFRHL